MLRKGSKSKQVYDMIAEFPGIKVSTAEIAAELEMSSHHAGSFAAQLHRSGYVQRELVSPGRAKYWVEP